jgi:CheY-like chemotaxis protein
VRTVAPSWTIREAANGETALRLVDKEKFDLIFMDMYMASVEKQLLGTETVKVLRNKGVDCRICGLSANDKETEFLEAGADVFTFKPFPCEARALTQELCRVLFRDDKPVE